MYTYFLNLNAICNMLLPVEVGDLHQPINMLHHVLLAFLVGVSVLFPPILKFLKEFIKLDGLLAAVTCWFVSRWPPGCITSRF